jgi:Mn2+/Fe2+ NRAMP family transporter
MAVLLTGTLLSEGATLMKLIEEVEGQLGWLSGLFVGVGIFAAGITSAITAPLAAGFIVNNFFSQSTYNLTRITAMSVIMAGIIMGYLDVQPETLILAAQAANGFALPLVAAFLWIVTNKHDVIGSEQTSLSVNVLTFVLLNVLVIIGLRSLTSVYSSVAGVEAALDFWVYPMVSALFTFALAFYIRKIRSA